VYGQLEQNKICVLTVTTLGIVMLTVQHDLMFSLRCMYDHRDVLRKTSPDVCSVEEWPFDILKTGDTSCG